jgi:hypothetical protein
MNSICVGFEHPFRKDPGFIAINLLADFIILLDIILLFQTTRINTVTGEEIYDLK